MRYTLALIIGISLALAACTGGGKKSSSGGQKPAVTDPGPTSNPDTSPEPRREVDECETGGINLVQDNVNYEDDLKDVIERACLAGCHDPGGQSSKDMSTYSDAKSYAKDMAESVSAGRMPIGGRSLSNSEKQLFEDWVDAGTPRSASDSSSNSDDSNTNDSSNDDDDFFGNCKDSVGDREDFDKEDILNLEAKRECNDSGQMYDYDLERCTEDLGDFNCDKEGIADAFRDARIDPDAIKRKIDEYENDGYEIDQCGFDGRAPLILFIKEFEEITSTDEGIGQRYLCRQGSSYCENN